MPLKTVFFAFHESVTHKPVASLLMKCVEASGRFLQVKFESRTTLCLKFLRNWNFLRISRLETTREGSHEMAKHKFFQHKEYDKMRKTFKTEVTKNHFWKQIKYSKIFLSFIIKQLSIHTSHLNIYNHTNEIDIH